MSQFDQMSDAEIDARFRISGPKPVAFLLAGYVKAREPFSVHFQHGEEMFLSTLLDAQADRLQLIALDPRMRRRCLGLANTFSTPFFSVT